MRSAHYKMLFLCILCSLFSLYSCQTSVSDSVTSMPVEHPPTTQSTLGGTQIYQPPPTIQFTSPRCIFYDSRDNRSRDCSLLSSCFSFIRRQDDGTFFIKRGCSFNCQEERRNKKIQVCCSTHLCNNHTLSEANFTNSVAPPPVQCYQSRTNETCDISTACYSRLVYQSDGTYQTQQGCIRGPQCEERADSRTIQRCCTSNLCNVPIPPSDHPRNDPATTPTSTPTPTSSPGPPLIVPSDPVDPGGSGHYLCNCDNCPSSTCRGLVCGTKVVYTGRLYPDVTLECVNDVHLCMTNFDPNPSPGTVDLMCCSGDLCNRPLVFPELPTIQTPPMPTTPTTQTTNTSTEVIVSSETTAPPTTAASDQLFFIFTAVLSVLGGVIVVGMVIVVVIILVLRIRKRGHKRVPLHTTSSRQQSPDCHMTACYNMQPRDSPLASSSSTSTNSGEIHLDTEFLKHLGTSV